MFDVLLVILAAFAGSTIQATTGSGLAIFFMAIVPMFIPVMYAAAATSLIGMASTGYISYKFRKYINFKIIIAPLIAFLASGGFAIYTSKYIPTLTLKMWLGLVLVALSIFFLLFNDKVKIKSCVINGIIAGACSGLLSGYFGIGGPPMIIYLLSVFDDKDEFIGTLQFYFFLSTIYTTTFRIFSGIITFQVLTFAFFGYIGMIFGVFLGLKIVNKLNIVLLRKLTYVFIGLSGLWTFISSII